MLLQMLNLSSMQLFDCTAPIEFSEAEDLKWNLSTSLTETRTIEFTEEQITIVRLPPSLFPHGICNY